MILLVIVKGEIKWMKLLKTTLTTVRDIGREWFVKFVKSIWVGLLRQDLYTNAPIAINFPAGMRIHDRELNGFGNG